MICTTAVTAWALHAGMTAALAAAMVAFGRAIAVTIASAAGFGGGHRVAIVPGLTALTTVAVGVAEAELAAARDPVAGGRIRGVNVPITKTGLTIATCGNQSNY